MLIKREREKLLNSIIYFAQHTDCCGKTKLFKLLHLLDFEHFRQTGRSVTGLDYYAWKMGPVPVRLDEEFDIPGDDFEESVDIVPEQIRDHRMYKIVPKKEFDPAYFSKRELRLLDQISSEFHSCNARKMVDVTHREDAPWTKIWRDGEGYNELIPYEEALDDDNREFILEEAKEHKEIVEHFS